MPSVKANPAKSKGERVKDKADEVASAMATIRQFEDERDTLRTQRDGLNEQITGLTARITALLGDVRRAAGDLKAALDE